MEYSSELRKIHKEVVRSLAFCKVDYWIAETVAYSLSQEEIKSLLQMPTSEEERLNEMNKLVIRRGPAQY